MSKYILKVTAGTTAATLLLIATARHIEPESFDLDEHRVVYRQQPGQESLGDLSHEYALWKLKQDLQEPEKMKKLLALEGYKWKDWQRDCRDCEWIESGEAKRLEDVAEDFDVEVPHGLPGRESDFMQFDKYGNPVESKKGAIGKLQVLGKMGKNENDPKMVGGFDEVWYIYNNPQPRHRKFIEKFEKSIKKYTYLMRGSRDEVWNNIQQNEVANEVNGFTYLGYLKEKSGGNISIALEKYVAGPNGRKKYPKNARKYRNSVLGRQEKWDNLSKEVCPKVKRINKKAEQMLYKKHRGNSIRSNI